MQAVFISYALLSGFVLTTLVGRWWTVSTVIWPAILCCLIAAALPRLRLISMLLTSCLCGITLATWNIQRSTHTVSSLSVDRYATGESVVAHGVIAAEPDRRPLQTKYTVRVSELQTASGTVIYPIDGLVLATDHRTYPRYYYGDHVQIQGKLEIPETIEQFDYGAYLSRYEIYSVIYRTNFLLKKPGPPSILGQLFQLKETFERQINRLYAEPQASFMAGLLTGSRKGIPEHLLADFNTTGLTHIIAISGYNITIIISIISGLLFWLPLRWRTIPAIAAIILFAVFVGASAAVVRAAIMGILGLMALHLGRTSEVRLTILWTLAIMTGWNPKLLWYDAGFQLSFLAVIGLTELAPLLDRWCQSIPQIFGIREAMQMTIAAQISAAPLLMILFGRLSLIAPIANLLVAPAIPLAMLCGFLGTVMSFVSFGSGLCIAYLGWACLEWILFWTHLLAQIPHASIDTPMLTAGWALLYYAGLCLWIATSGKVAAFARR